jgi:hypothetical protein
MTEPLPTAYIFASADGATLALTVAADGSNLPLNVQWKPRETVVMISAALAAHVSNPQVAMTNLIMRGYHLSRLSAEILKFPQANRNSS